MSNKEELLQQLRDALDSKMVSKKDVLEIFALDEGSRTDGYEGQTRSKFSFVEILYYIGGAIVFLGLTILVGQNWSDFNSLTRILIAMGSAVAAYIIGVLLYRQLDTKGPARAFFLISAALSPLGVYTILDAFDVRFSNGQQMWVAFVLMSAFLVSYKLYKEISFMLFAIIYGTWLYSSAISLALNMFEFDYFDIELYPLLALGVSYVLLARYLSKQSSNLASLSGTLYFFGSSAVSLAVLMLGGWEPEQSIFWEFMFVPLVFGGMYLSTVLKSKAVLSVSALSLIIYIFKITSEYFADSIGWPVALVIAGFGTIAAAYFSVRINSKYIKR